MRHQPFLTNKHMPFAFNVVVYSHVRDLSLAQVIPWFVSYFSQIQACEFLAKGPKNSQKRLLEVTATQSSHPCQCAMSTLDCGHHALVSWFVLDVVRRNRAAQFLADQARLAGTRGGREAQAHSLLAQSLRLSQSRQHTKIQI